jgi:hypothetical protein
MDSTISYETQKVAIKLRWYHYIMSIISLICSSFLLFIFILIYYYNFIDNGIEQFIYNYPKLSIWHFRFFYILVANTSCILTFLQIIFLIKKKRKAIISTFLITILWIIFIYLSLEFLESFHVSCGEP